LAESKVEFFMIFSSSPKVRNETDLLIGIGAYGAALAIPFLISILLWKSD